MNTKFQSELTQNMDSAPYPLPREREGVKTAMLRKPYQYPNVGARKKSSRL